MPQCIRKYPAMHMWKYLFKKYLSKACVNVSYCFLVYICLIIHLCEGSGILLN